MVGTEHHLNTNKMHTIMPFSSAPLLIDDPLAAVPSTLSPQIRAYSRLLTVCVSHGEPPISPRRPLFSRKNQKMLPSVVRAAFRPAASTATRAMSMASPAMRLANMRPTFAPAANWSRAFASGFLPKEEVQSRVMSVVKNFQNVDPAKVTATSHFTNDLGLDSLDTVEVSKKLPESQV